MRTSSQKLDDQKQFQAPKPGIEPTMIVENGKTHIQPRLRRDLRLGWNRYYSEEGERYYLVLRNC